MKERVKTSPDMLISSALHKAAKDLGNEHFSLWTRNVQDHFKDKPTEEIRSILKKSAFPYAVCFENVIGDFNLGTGIRNANAFNAKEVFYLGDKRFDKRACVGVHNYTCVNFISSIEEFIKLKEKYYIVGVDNIAGSVPLSSYQWKENTLMVFGEEGVGITPDMQKLCEEMVAIEMFGSVRSLNCGTASGIVMNDFITKYRIK